MVDSTYCSRLQVPTEIVDRNDGTYEVKFTAHKAATFCLKVGNSLSP